MSKTYFLRLSRITEIKLFFSDNITVASATFRCDNHSSLKLYTGGNYTPISGEIQKIVYKAG